MHQTQRLFAGAVCALTALLFVAAPQANAQNAADASGRFNGSIRGTSFGGALDNARYSGAVDVSPSEKGGAGNWKVEIKLSTMGSSSMGSMTNALQWSLSPGRCGSRVQFLVPPTELPQLELRSGGNAEVTWEGAITLAPSGSYQLMIYGRGLREQDIVACANLRFSAPKK